MAVVPPVSLIDLPTELFDAILSYLSKPDLCNIARVSSRHYESTLSRLYREVRLVDRHNPDALHGDDDHDDTDIIGVLMTLCKKPWLASKVIDLYHGCQVPPPDIFSFLPFESFKGRTLSHDPRLRGILKIAISHMVNVRTLTIIHGHFSITKELIRGLFHLGRKCQTPVRKLWVESSCFEEIWNSVSQEGTVAGLRSVRLRRMSVIEECYRNLWPEGLEISRGGRRLNYRSIPTMSTAMLQICDDATEQLEQAVEWDRVIYGKFPDIDDVTAKSVQDLPIPDHGNRGSWASPVSIIRSLFISSTDTLTSLNLDWLEGLGVSLEAIFRDLPLFPNLKAFQVRNAVTDETEIDPSVSLFEPESLFFHFIRNHQKIEYLAWPMRNFFPSSGEPLEDPRVVELISELGRRLKFLRIDAHLTIHEALTDESTGYDPRSARTSRRKVVRYLAPEMRYLEGLKIEGGVPKDEVRELLRGLSHCPLKKLVVLGFDYPLKDWWDNPPADENPPTAAQTKQSLSNRKFVPKYGKGLPLLDVIQWIYNDTMEELKFLGSHHVFCLNQSYPETIFSRVFSPLVRFRRLHELTLAFSLRTEHQGAEIAADVAGFWISSQSSAPRTGSSSDLTNTQRLAERDKHLRENFAPRKLAERVVEIMGRYLYICQRHEDRNFSPQTDGNSTTTSLTPLTSNSDSPDIPKVVSVRAYLRVNDNHTSEIFELGIGVRPDQSIAWIRGPYSELQREPQKVREWF
ncbi:MAG: hypothetical protein M1839_008305 [Geoglossum umbratile]|nr:MAG: hypothetical protein M1839_008305 [Geoglossum umbratile]